MIYVEYKKVIKYIFIKIVKGSSYQPLIISIYDNQHDRKIVWGMRMENYKLFGFSINLNVIWHLILLTRQ